jgi:hypothetical protein
MTQEEEEEEGEEEAAKLKDRAEQIKRKKKKKRGRHKVEWFVSDGSNGERRLLINAGVTHSTPAFIGLHNMYGYSIQKKNLLFSFLVFRGEQKMMKKQMISMSSSLPLCPCVCRQTRNKGESTQIISST